MGALGSMALGSNGFTLKPRAGAVNGVNGTKANAKTEVTNKISMLNREVMSFLGRYALPSFIT